MTPDSSSWFRSISSEQWRALVAAQLGWRVLFLLGLLPAFFTLWIRHHVREPGIWINQSRSESHHRHLFAWEIFRPPLIRKTTLGSIITLSVLFAYWGPFTWMPSFLARPLEQGGAALGVVKSCAWIIPMQIGAFLGYILFGVFADKFGRRPVFLLFLVSASLLVPVYGQLARHELLLLGLGPLIGFFGHGYFSLFGAILSELFPTRVRGAAQGFVYNVGRAFSALAPYTIGVLADRYGVGSTLAITSAFFLVGAFLVFFLLETRAERLE